jgi:hypothetical protein
MNVVDITKFYITKSLIKALFRKGGLLFLHLSQMKEAKAKGLDVPGLWPNGILHR